MGRTRAQVRLLTYQRAAQRAEENHLSVIGQTTRAWDGAPQFHVPSVSEPGRIHIVTWLVRDINGGSLVCDCWAAWRGDYCMHRAYVRAYLLSQQKQPA